ncbi:hypothetical protein M0R27_003979 [Escherichia coli]|nr:hypothetical protein [Salmonella enterica]EHF4692716.1 hypothetical protein [Salmonella enterica subsp. enterica serovar Muenchen]EIT2172753.1 hypothetical protein [Shigella sonnei]EJC8066233.1 hypothetical protein [Escherichia coli]EIJ6786017.1 hypothetical protein [Salmonella enterica]
MYVPPESPSAENRPQCGGRQAETAAPSGAVALHTVRCAGSAAYGATEEKRRHNNGMWWSLAHHSRTGENRENRNDIYKQKKVKFLHFFTLIYRADLAIVMIK